MRKQKGEILLTVLARLAEGVGEFAELFAAIAAAGYGVSSGKIQYVLHENRRASARAAHEHRAEINALRKYRTLLSALKRDGLVAERATKLGRAFAITKKGLAKLAALRKQRETMLPSTAYQVAKSSAISIVTFDVPERERRKRDWLRAVLRRLEFTPVQKSVWVGKIRLPQEFLDDIKKLRLAEFVEIFQVTKGGNLRHIV